MAFPPASRPQARRPRRSAQGRPPRPRSQVRPPRGAPAKGPRRPGRPCPRRGASAGSRRCAAGSGNGRPSALLESSRQGTPAWRRARAISSFFRVRSGRTWILGRPLPRAGTTAWTARGAARPAAPLPRARRISIVSAMSSSWWPSQSTRRRRAGHRGLEEAEAGAAGLALAPRRAPAPSTARRRAARPRAPQSVRQKRGVGRRLRARAGGGRNAARSAGRGARGQCAQRRRRSATESAPPERATAQRSARRPLVGPGDDRGMQPASGQERGQRAAAARPSGTAAASSSRWRRRRAQANVRCDFPKWGTRASGIRTRPSASRLFSRIAARTRGTARPEPFSVCTSSALPDSFER